MCVCNPRQLRKRRGGTYGTKLTGHGTYLPVGFLTPPIQREPTRRHRGHGTCNTFGCERCAQKSMLANLGQQETNHNRLKHFNAPPSSAHQICNARCSARPIKILQCGTPCVPPTQQLLRVCPAMCSARPQSFSNVPSHVPRRKNSDSRTDFLQYGHFD